MLLAAAYIGMEPPSWSNTGYYAYDPHQTRPSHRDITSPTLPTTGIMEDPIHSGQVSIGSGNPRRYNPSFPLSDYTLQPPSLPQINADHIASGSGSAPASSSMALPPFSQGFHSAYHSPPLGQVGQMGQMGQMPQIGSLSTSAQAPHTSHLYPQSLPPVQQVGYSTYPLTSQLDMSAPPAIQQSTIPRNQLNRQHSSEMFHQTPPRLTSLTGLGGYVTTGSAAIGIGSDSATTVKSGGAGSYSSSSSVHHLSPISPITTQQSGLPTSFHSTSLTDPILSSGVYPVRSLEDLQAPRPGLGTRRYTGPGPSTGHGHMGGGRGGDSGRREHSMMAESNRSWSNDGDGDERYGGTGSGPWGMPQEEYKALNPRDKKQVRNRIGARRFRAKRKDYVATLEGNLRDKDDEITSLRNQLGLQHREINDYRQRLGLTLLPSPLISHQPMLGGHDTGLGLMGATEEWLTAKDEHL